MPSMQTKSVIIIALVILCAVMAGGYVFTQKPIQEEQIAQIEQVEETAQVDTDKTTVDEQDAPDESFDNIDSQDQSAQTQTQAAPPPPPVTEGGILGVRALGNPNAPIRMTEYFSLTCSHCAHFHLNTLPDLKKRYIESGDLYIRYEEFPLNAPALDASMLARCLPVERYHGFIDLLFKTQESWISRPDYKNALMQNAKLAGMGEDKAKACLEQNQLKAAIAGRIQEVTAKHKITSTPSFIINEGQDMISGSKPLYEFEQIFKKYLPEQQQGQEQE